MWVRKGFSTQHCLVVMLGRWKKAFDKNKHAGVFLTVLSKVFDCIHYELLIAKLEAYGFGHESLTFIYSYLSSRRQRMKVNGSFSDWSNITPRVPQGSILGPLLFNIDFNDIFYIIPESEMTNFADDNTTYTIEERIDTLLMGLWKHTSILNRWVKDNFLKISLGKGHFLVCNHPKEVSIILENEIINNSNSVKLFGVTIDKKLDFNEHVTELCKKANQKLHEYQTI